VETTGPQRKRLTKEYFEKRPGERNVDSRIHLVQLEEDGGGSTRQSWMETSGLWQRQGISPVTFVLLCCFVASVGESSSSFRCFGGSSN